MRLNSDEERALLIQYEPYLMKQVHSFVNRTNRRRDEFEDLLQEARLAFLIHLRRINDESEIRLCRFRIFGALYEYCERMALVRIPHNCFKKEVARFSRDPRDYAEAECESSRCMENDVDFNILFDQFSASLSKCERSVLALKLDGLTGREIMESVGISTDYAMSRLLKKIKQKILNHLHTQEDS